MEKDSKEWADRLPADAKARLDAALESGRQALRSGEADAIRQALDELNAAYSAAGASLYQAAGAGPQRRRWQSGGAPVQPGPPGRGQPAQDDVVDADYEIVDEKK